MVETHPFGNFVPYNSKFLILGSFAGRQSVKGTSVTDDDYDWFYGTRRNQFWQILEAVYSTKLSNLREKQDLFSKLGISIADIILQCERMQNNNLDNNLTNIVYNIDAISDILNRCEIEKVFFMSHFVKMKFNQNFKELMGLHPAVLYVTLPSPSPRYAKMSLAQKIQHYRELLPKR